MVIVPDLLEQQLLDDVDPAGDIDFSKAAEVDLEGASPFDVVARDEGDSFQ